MRYELREWADSKVEPVVGQHWEPKPELGYTSVYIDSLKPIPKGWAPLIGDALSNYHAALDHLAYALVDGGSSRWRLRVRSKIKREKFAREIYFPIFGAPLPDYSPQNEFVRSHLPGVDPKHVNALAPFQPGKRPGRRRGQLSVLHRLNNLDKHRKPLLTHHVVLRGTTQMSLVAPVTMVPVPGWSRLKPGTELVHLVWEFAQFPSTYWNPAFNPEELSMSVKFITTCSVAFGDLEPRLEVDTVLSEISRTVREILEAIERV